MRKSLADSFPENLRAERARANVSQRELALAAGLTVSYVSKLERCERTPLISTVDSLARALRIDPQRLLASNDPSGA